jgi:LPXTG-motif cell wall-anchored protein
VLNRAFGGRLPYTGLPVWALALTGLGLIGLGVLVGRRRPELAQT